MISRSRQVSGQAARVYVILGQNVHGDDAQRMAYLLKVNHKHEDRVKLLPLYSQDFFSLYEPERQFKKAACTRFAPAYPLREQ